PCLAQALDHLIRQGAAATDDADRPGDVDMVGDEPDLALLGRDDAGAVRAQQHDAVPLHELGRAQHVVHRDPLGDAHGERDVRAASIALVAGTMPARCRSARPSSSFVPVIRTTSGFVMCSSSRAAMIPRATSSPRVMPPKMLMNTPRTFGSSSTISSALRAFSALAPPPMSRKFAGSPPCCLTRSSVFMVNPAPFPMHPTVPSRCTYVSPLRRASAPSGSSPLEPSALWSAAISAATSRWRYSAFSSISSLPSAATSAPL